MKQPPLRLFSPPTKNRALRAVWLRGFDAALAAQSLDACPYPPCEARNTFRGAFRRYWCDGWRAGASTRAEVRNEALRQVNA